MAILDKAVIENPIIIDRNIAIVSKAFELSKLENEENNTKKQKNITLIIIFIIFSIFIYLCNLIN